MQVADRDSYETEEEWEDLWLKPRGLETQTLRAPPGSVVIVHTFTAHAVLPKQSEGTRWCVLWAYCVPGAAGYIESNSRMVTEDFQAMCEADEGGLKLVVARL